MDALRTTLEPTLLTEVHRIDRRTLERLAIFVGLYLLAATAAVLWSREPGWASLAVRVPLYVLAGASLHGVSLFVHEGVHGVLSKRAWLNRALSIACAVPVGQNFAGYRVLHLRHHADTGGGSDPDDYRNYSSRGWVVLGLNWGRLIMGYPVYLVVIPTLGLWYASWTERAWILLEVALVVAFVLALALLLPREVFVHGWLLPMLCINTMVNIRGMSQHTLLPDSLHRIRGTRTILTNRVVQYFMCNENYHLEHHLYPQVPWYHLPRLHGAIKDDLAAQGAPFIPSYGHFVGVFLRENLALLRSRASTRA
jgi:fatty acid desaturase